MAPAAAAAYGRLRATLEQKGTPIGLMDLLIAAHALSLGVRLVTNNAREFRRVPGLRIENWVEGIKAAIPRRATSSLHKMSSRFDEMGVITSMGKI